MITTTYHCSKFIRQAHATVNETAKHTYLVHPLGDYVQVRRNKIPQNVKASSQTSASMPTWLPCSASSSSTFSNRLHWFPGRLLIFQTNPRNPQPVFPRPLRILANVHHVNHVVPWCFEILNTSLTSAPIANDESAYAHIHTTCTSLISSVMMSSTTYTRVEPLWSTGHGPIHVGISFNALPSFGTRATST